jgi:prepilin-type N-terminal cleavage/methylation domain-containing protein
MKMKKYGFTLIEILVSVVLIGLISIFATSLIYQAKQDSKMFEKRVVSRDKTELLDEVLYKDIFQAKTIKASNNKKYDVLYIKSKNSIYGIAEPYIVWLVLRNDNTLIRMESAREITLPIKEEYKKYIFLDKVSKNCESFSVNISKNTKNILYFVKIKGKKPILFEVEKLE